MGKLYDSINVLGISQEKLFKVHGDEGIPPEHSELHRRLQAILDTEGQDSLGIKVNIDRIYEGVLADTKRRPAPKKAKQPSQKSEAGGS